VHDISKLTVGWIDEALLELGRNYQAQKVTNLSDFIKWIKANEEQIKKQPPF